MELFGGRAGEGDDEADEPVGNAAARHRVADLGRLLVLRRQDVVRRGLLERTWRADLRRRLPGGGRFEDLDGYAERDVHRRAWRDDRVERRSVADRVAA